MVHSYARSEARWRGLKPLCVTLFLASFTVLATPCPGKEFTAKVVAVLDADTITVLHDGKEEAIRLNGIDCPEKNQPHGDDAKKFTASRILNKVVTIQAHDMDRDGQIIADVLLADGTNLNREQAKQGLAWWFFRYSKDETLKQLESQAREGKLELCPDPIPIPPWVFRKIQRKQVPDLSDFQYPGSTVSGVLASKRSHVYRDSSCKGYAAMVERKNVMTFTTAKEAEEAGCREASDCSRDSAKQ